MGKSEYIEKLPFREHTTQERKHYQTIAGVINDKRVSNEKLWKSTKPRALEIIDSLRFQGYRTTEIEAYTEGIERGGYGERVLLIPPRKNVIVGSLNLWRAGGFIEPPFVVKAMYRGPGASEEQIREALKLHRALVLKGDYFVLVPEKKNQTIERRVITQQGTPKELELFEMIVRLTRENEDERFGRWCESMRTERDAALAMSDQMAF